MTTQPPTERIALAVQNSGLLFKHRIAAALTALDFSAEVRSRLPGDREEDADVRAFRWVEEGGERLPVSVNLLCACVDTTTPFVFVGGKRSPAQLRPSHFVFPYSEYERKQDRSSIVLHPFQHFELHASHYYCKQQVEATDVFAAEVAYNNSQAVPAAALEPAVKNVLAAVAYHLGRAEASRRWQPNAVTLLFPVVVVSGGFFFADGEGVLASDAVTFVRTSTPKKDEQASDVLIDFVTEQGLQDHLSNSIWPFVTSVAKIAKERPNEVATQRQ
jgi:hypothetical protein